MERGQRSGRRSSGYFAAVEPMNSRDWAQPTGYRHERREAELRETARPTERLGRRSGEETRGWPSFVNPSLGLPRSSEYRSRSQLPQRTIKSTGPQKPRTPRVPQDVVKPGSNKRTRKRQEQRDRAAEKARPRAFARSKSNQNASESRKDRERARERSARHRIVNHSQTGHWLRSHDWRTRGRELGGLGSKPRDIIHKSGAERRPSSHQDYQAARDYFRSTGRSPAEAALPRAVEGPPSPKTTNGRGAQRKSQDIILKTFGQQFIDDINAICKRTAAPGGAQSPNDARELDTLGVKEERQADSDCLSDVAGKFSGMDISSTKNFDTTASAREPLKDMNEERSLAAEFMDLNYGIIEPIQQQNKIEPSHGQTKKTEVPPLYVGSLPFSIAPKDIQTLFEHYKM